MYVRIFYYRLLFSRLEVNANKNGGHKRLDRCEKDGGAPKQQQIDRDASRNEETGSVKNYTNIERTYVYGYKSVKMFL